MRCLHRLTKLRCSGWLACCVAACSSPAPPRVDASPLSPTRVRAICEAAVEGRPPGDLSLPAGSGGALPEDGEFVVLSEPRGCECVLVLRGRVVTSKQFKCR